MNTLTNISGTLIPYAHVAREAGLEDWALQSLEPDGFRQCATNVRELQGRLFLTFAGAMALADRLELRGYAVRAHAVRVMVRQHESTPSRALITPAPKDAPVHHPWMGRADISG